MIKYSKNFICLLIAAAMVFAVSCKEPASGNAGESSDGGSLAADSDVSGNAAGSQPEGDNASSTPSSAPVSSVAPPQSSAVSQNSSNSSSSSEEKPPRLTALNLMSGVTAKSAAEKAADEKFNAAMADFAVSLFQKSANKTESSMISPLSVMLALSMTANGASGNTLKEMENVLGGGMTISELNAYLKTYVKSLPNTDKTRMMISNSIWFAEGFEVKKPFLQTNADYYGASVFEAKFDQSTVDDINKWVSYGTRGMIDKIIDSLHPNDRMHLINTIAFEADWETPYYESQVSKDNFTSLSGGKKSVDFLNGTEYQFISDSKATGFIKGYDGKYSFAALLPNEGVTLDQYVTSLTGTSLLNTLKSFESVKTITKMPKFESKFDLKMNDVLISMGMPSAFSGAADFSKLSKEPLFIGQVLHKTFISVTERGTRAGAATDIAMRTKGAMITSGDTRTVTLDRPFMYAIIDNTNKLPVFLGTVTDIK